MGPLPGAANPDVVVSGGLSEAAGHRSGWKMNPRLTDEESAAIGGVIGKSTFNEMCILYPLISRMDGDDWLERVKYSRNFWYHIPGEAQDLPKVRGPTNWEHKKEFIPFTYPLPLN